jgi:hypothetical protein
MTTIVPPEYSGWFEERKNRWWAEQPSAPRKVAHGLAKPYDATWATPDAQPSNWQAGLTRASSIKPEPVSWLWKGWLARGKMHIIAGQPGTGKTTIAMKMAATVSAGGRWPDCTTARQGNIIIWSGEDDPADTLVPRLEASGADLSKVFFGADMTCGKERRPFDPAKDILALQAAIEEAGGAALIIVDPIVSATTADSHKNGETRRALQPLVDMAAKLGAALVGVTHLTKGSEGRSPIDRVTGSVAFGALARVVMVAAREQDGSDRNPGKRIFMRAKSNIGADDGGFKYDLQQVPMRGDPEIIASVVSWGNAVEGTARDILAAAEAVDEDKGAATAFGEAKDFLLDHLMDGPKSAKECKAAARDAGHSWRTNERVKANLNVSSVKRGDGWVWALPDQDRQEKRDTATHSSPGGVGGLGGLQQNQQVTGGQDRQENQGRQDRQGSGVEGVAARDGGLDGWECEF